MPVLAVPTSPREGSMSNFLCAELGLARSDAATRDKTRDSKG